MGITKKLNFSNIFLFLFLILFPFGQIIRIGIIHPIDLVVGMGALVAILQKTKKPVVIAHFRNFIWVVLFSWVFSVILFKQFEVLYGLLYLLRLTAYFYFFVYVWNFVRQTPRHAGLLMGSLLSLSIVSAVFGWIQYFAIPDIKPFFTWGWDEHLFRLVGTFLDPTFLALILVFGLLISLLRFLENGDKKYLYLVIFLLVSLAFTYSRAGYLALGAGLFIFGVYKKKLKAVLFILVSLGIIVSLLPTSKNKSIEFLRSFSAIARIDNYKNTLQIYTKSPIFGVGYNNMCLANQKYIGPQSFKSHACSGSDSSLLFILATTGLAGFFSLIFLINKTYHSLVHLNNPHTVITVSLFVSAFVHSFFSNSLFYPWVLGYLLLTLAVALGGKAKG